MKVWHWWGSPPRFEIEPGWDEIEVSMAPGGRIRFAGINSQVDECYEFYIGDLLDEIGVIPGLVRGSKHARGKIRVMKDQPA